MTAIRLCFVLALFASGAIAQTTRPGAAELLQRRVDVIDIGGLTLPQAILLLQEKSRLNIVGGWSNLTLRNVDLTQKLRGKLHDVTARMALDHILNEATDGRVSWTLGPDDLIVLGTSPIVETKVYRVGRLLDQLTEGRNDDRTNAMDELIKLLVGTIEPDTWRDAGGTLGAVSAMGTRLIISTSPANHGAIGKFLKNMEQIHAQ